jgi:hypothetical protein
MRLPRRSVSPRLRRKLPPRSRLTLRPQPSAPLHRAGGLVEALRHSREALADVERQLESLLAAVRTAKGPDADAADRLHRAARRAGAAVDRLG